MQAKEAGMQNYTNQFTEPEYFPQDISFTCNLCDARLSALDMDAVTASVLSKLNAECMDGGMQMSKAQNPGAQEHRPRNELDTPAITRIYLGSYYCEQSFLAITDDSACGIADYCSKRDIAITLVMPSPLEFTREAVYRKAEHLAQELGSTLDEICVNDIGTLGRAIEACASSGLRIVAGRLFFKQQRDPRTPEAIMASHMSAASLDLEQEIGAISCIEADLAFTQLYLDKSIPAGCTLALHYPFSLVSRMRVCQFAHDSHPASPFTAAAPCRFECRSEMMEYRAPEGARFYKAGKSIVAPTDATLSDAIRSLPSDRPIRIIWQPSFEEVTR